MAGVRLKAGLAAVAAAALGAIGWACAGGPDAPTWTLTDPEFNVKMKIFSFTLI